jgi:hypothetical protein
MGQRAGPAAIAQLSNGKVGEAFAVAVQAEKYIAMTRCSTVLACDFLVGFYPTTPPGASISPPNYNVPDSSWEFVGRSPIRKLRLPLVDSQWRFELKGFAVAGVHFGWGAMFGIRLFVGG